MKKIFKFILITFLFISFNSLKAKEIDKKYELYTDQYGTYYYNINNGSISYEKFIDQKVGTDEDIEFEDDSDEYEVGISTDENKDFIYYVYPGVSDEEIYDYEYDTKVFNLLSNVHLLDFSRNKDAKLNFTKNTKIGKLKTNGITITGASGAGLIIDKLKVDAYKLNDKNEQLYEVSAKIADITLYDENGEIIDLGDEKPDASDISGEFGEDDGYLPLLTNKLDKTTDETYEQSMTEFMSNPTLYYVTEDGLTKENFDKYLESTKELLEELFSALFTFMFSMEEETQVRVELTFDSFEDGTYKLTEAIEEKDVEWTEGRVNLYINTALNTEIDEAGRLIIGTKYAEKSVVPTISISKGHNNRLVLSWNKDSSVAKYYVYRSTSKSSGYKKIATVTESTYTDKDLTYGKTYYYKVIAYGINGDKTGYSNIVSKKVTPNKVENLTFESASSDYIKLSWDKVSGSGYEIYRASSIDGTYSKVTTITSSSTVSYKNKKLSSNKKYYYKVRAYKTVSGKKVYGSYSDIVLMKTAPAKPTISISSKDYQTLGVKISDVKGASYYKIYKSTSETGTYTKVGEIISGTFTESNLTTGKKYYYKVKACNSDGTCGSYSSILNKKPSLKTPTLTIEKDGLRDLYISSSEVDGADGYEFYRSNYETKNYKLKKTNTTGIYVNTVDLNENYYYKVRAYRLVNDKKVYSSYSSVKNIKVTLGKPTVTLSSTESKKVNISLTSVDYADGYAIYRSKSKDSGYTKIATIKDLENLKFEDSTSSNEKYYYKVRSYVLISGVKVYGGYTSVKSITSK